jgi:hypothetical protein
MRSDLILTPPLLKLQYSRKQVMERIPCPECQYQSMGQHLDPHTNFQVSGTPPSNHSNRFWDLPMPSGWEALSLLPCLSEFKFGQI